MRRLLLPVFSLLLLLTAVAPAAAASQTSYSVRGSGAWGSAVLYGDGRFEAGWVEIGDELWRASDGTTYLSYVLFEHLLETCDETGCTQVYTVGLAEGVPFTIDRKKLLSAAVDADIEALRCTSDGETETCDWVVVPVSVEWAGYGPAIRSHGTANGGLAGAYQYTLNGAATERWATVTGSIDTFDLEAAGATGAIYRTRLAERTITHY